MGIVNRLKGVFSAKDENQKGYPRVTARVSKEEDRIGLQGAFASSLSTIAAKFPFELYSVIDNLALIDPYVSKFVYSSIALGNSGHTLEIDTSSESEADKIIMLANDLAARCYPFAGGMDGLVNGLLSQVARSGGLAVEWVPDNAISRVERAFVIPMKTIKFRYDTKGNIVLCQDQGIITSNSTIGLVPLNPVQTTFHGATSRDGNPYPIPPALAALESCAVHRTIADKIKQWMDKVSALGVLLAEVEPPPREPGETQQSYDTKASRYLQDIATSITDNMSSGIGVAYNNTKFVFQNTQASAQGAKDILQIILQGLFSGLSRHPIFFGWNFSTTESYAKVVYEEMMQGIISFQQGVKRAIEHGHRLNLALNGYGNVGVSVHFNSGGSLDEFRDAEAEYMTTQSVLAQIESGVISVEEARQLLGHEDVKAGSGEFVAAFDNQSKRYNKVIKNKKKIWSGFKTLNQSYDDFDLTYETFINNELDNSSDNGIDDFISWLMIQGDLSEEDFIKNGTERLISYIEREIDTETVTSKAQTFLTDYWQDAKRDRKLFGGRYDKLTQGLSDAEKLAIAYLVADVEPFQVGSFISKSSLRTKQIENFLSSYYRQHQSGDYGLLKAQLGQFFHGLSDNASELIAKQAFARAKTWGSLYSLKEEGISEFVIDGPRDDLKCEYCWSMLGRVFSVEREIRHIENIIDSQDPDIAKVGKDVYSRYYGKDGASKLASTPSVEIQNTGLAAPPYHPRCRDYIVARRIK